MDGLLIIDKPAGPTSHDVVARMRRALRERRIGHTGTLDPAATGVLALVLGRATRLAQFLSDCDKSYEAVVRFGFATDTGDAQGRAIGTMTTTPLPSRAAIDAALDAFRGSFQQQPPAFSAKKIGGKRSHRLARERARHAALAAAHRPLSSRSEREPDFPDRPDLRDLADSPAAPDLLPPPVSVTVHRLEVASAEPDRVTLRIDCSAGFYVRALAHDLGERLGSGAHLVALRRTRVGDFTVDRALPLDAIERNPAQAGAAIVPMTAMLPRLPAVTLTPDGVRRAIHGCDLGESDGVIGQWPATNVVEAHHSPVPSPKSPMARLVDPAGRLIGIGRYVAARGVLHPSVILM